jgi:hypothetical protein
MTEFQNMCSPAKLYLVVSMVSIASMFFSTYNVMNLFESLLVTGVWTFILNMLCKRGSSTISWMILLLPLFSVVFIGMSAGYNVRGYEHMRHLKRHRLY